MWRLWCELLATRMLREGVLIVSSAPVGRGDSRLLVALSSSWGPEELSNFSGKLMDRRSSSANIILLPLDLLFCLAEETLEGGLSDLERRVVATAADGKDSRSVVTFGTESRGQEGELDSLSSRGAGLSNSVSGR